MAFGKNRFLKIYKTQIHVVSKISPFQSILFQAFPKFHRSLNNPITVSDFFEAISMFIPRKEQNQARPLIALSGPTCKKLSPPPSHLHERGNRKGKDMWPRYHSFPFILRSFRKGEWHRSKELFDVQLFRRFNWKNRVDPIHNDFFAYAWVPPHFHVGILPFILEIEKNSLKACTASKRTENIRRNQLERFKWGTSTISMRLLLCNKRPVQKSTQSWAKRFLILSTIEVKPQPYFSLQIKPKGSKTFFPFPTRSVSSRCNDHVRRLRTWTRNSFLLTKEKLFSSNSNEIVFNTENQILK